MEALLTSGEAHRAAGAPTAALPYVLAALHHARRLSLDLAAAEAVVALAHIWLALGASPEKGSSAFELGLRPLEAAEAAVALADVWLALSAGTRTFSCAAHGVVPPGREPLTRDD